MSEVQKVATSISNRKGKLQRRARKEGIWENLGQKDVRELRDKYDTSNQEVAKRIEQFDIWCMELTAAELQEGVK